MLVEFDLTKLGDLEGGRVLEAINQALERAIFDCDDRPTLDKARTVNLKINLVPVADDRGHLDSIDVAFTVGESKPARTGRPCNLAVKKIGNRFRMLFNDLSPDNARQRTIDEVIDSV